MSSQMSREPRFDSYRSPVLAMGGMVAASQPLAVAAGLQTLHTIIPSLITREANGSLYGPFGVMGSFMQPQGHAQVVVAMVDDGLDPQAALNRPRFCIEDGTVGGRVVGLEEGMPFETMSLLARRGHAVYPVHGYDRPERSGWIPVRLACGGRCAGVKSSVRRWGNLWARLRRSPSSFLLLLHQARASSSGSRLVFNTDYV